jgi:hypothetical protein
MNRASRFRPRLELLEDRSLLNASVIYASDGVLTIDARQDGFPDHVTLTNNGNGKISGAVEGTDTNVPIFFLNVSIVQIFGNPAGITVNYSQLGDADNPSGDEVYKPFPGQAGMGFGLFANFAAGGANSLTADFSGHALLTPVSVVLLGGGGVDKVSVNATGVNIGFGSRFEVDLFPTTPGADLGGTLNFSMTYSGTNRGTLSVQSPPGDYSDETLNLNATFLGSPRSGLGRFRSPHGAPPGDLSLAGGFDDNTLVMNLDTPGGLSATGDVFGTGHGVNTCFRTSNVHSHNCQPDFVTGRRIIHFTPNL